jgi:hypothetical protein
MSPSSSSHWLTDCVGHGRSGRCIVLNAVPPLSSVLEVKRKAIPVTGRGGL